MSKRLHPMTPRVQPDRRQVNEGQLIQPPRIADRITFPSDFGRRYTVFVYVQEAFNMDASIEQDGLSIQYLPDFQRITEAHGIIPTYFINYQIAQSPAATEILRPIADAGRCIIAAQLQPWLTPPFEERRTAITSYAGNLPITLEREKLMALTQAIAESYGQRPTIYRAGRFGVGRHTAQLLTEAGYRMDISVRPYYNYRIDGGPNFLRHNALPHWVGTDKMLISLPLSVGYIGLLRRLGRRLHQYHKQPRSPLGILARAGISRIALTPEGMPLNEAKEAVRLMLAEGHKMLSIALHSPSLIPGQSPYVRTSAELNAFYRWLEEMFGYLAKQNVLPIAADAVIAAAWAKR